MIREIEVGNYQSLRRMKVRLGKFTVITGPTGTGKSAFIRAVKTLAFNASGTAYISRGEKSCLVAASGDEIERTGMDDDHWKAAIHRGVKNAYDLEVPAPPDEDAGGDFTKRSTFTKLQGKVPEQVSGVLRLTDLNFAGQLDAPYLLDATGSEVARVLGRLTNVTLLYKAAQEANRRRLASSGQLKIRQADLAALHQQVQGYATMPAEKLAVEVAEQALARMQEAEQKLVRLGMLADAMARALAAQDMLAATTIPEPPSLAHLEEELAARWQRLRFLTGAVDDASLALAGKQPWVTSAREQEAQAQRELQAYTDQWGVCDKCGQPVRK